MAKARFGFAVMTSTGKEADETYLFAKNHNPHQQKLRIID
jgi:hypothetical protein